MMPTFPSPPLKFRTAGFPQYGFKAGFSDEAFLGNVYLNVAQFASALRALRGSMLSSLNVEAICSVMHRHSSSFGCSTPGALAPDRVLLSRSINA
jgi:hypothetical protein